MSEVAAAIGTGDRSLIARLRNRVPSAIAIEIALILVLLVIGAALSEQFRTLDNLANIYEQASVLLLVSLGQTVVILTGGIDLSFEGNIALTGSILSGQVHGDVDLLMPVIIGVLLIGTVAGLANGGLILLLRVHPLIVTLAIASVLQGAALLYTQRPIGGMPDGFDSLAYGRIWGIPVGSTLVLVGFLVVGLLLKYTRLGRQIFAYGGDPAAARLVGIPVTRIVLFTYGLSGFLASATAIFLVARLGVGNPVNETPLNLSSITPVILGGTMLSGGRGGVVGTLLGVLLLQTLSNLLNFLEVSTFYQWMIQGFIVIAAVASHLDRRRRRA